MPKVYVLLKPDDMAAEDPVNFHVIEAERHPITGALIFPYSDTALDGQYKKRRNARIEPWQDLGTDAKTVRVTLAQAQNEGLPICGNCARRFYADSRRP